MHAQQKSTKAELSGFTWTVKIQNNLTQPNLTQPASPELVTTYLTCWEGLDPTAYTTHSQMPSFIFKDDYFNFPAKNPGMQSKYVVNKKTINRHYSCSSSGTFLTYVCCYILNHLKESFGLVVSLRKKTFLVELWLFNPFFNCICHQLITFQEILLFAL